MDPWADAEISDEEGDDILSTFRSMPPGEELPAVNNWRGLAHYRTWSRRRVFQKSPDKRIQSELYLLEETITDLEPIASLPHSVRLEICRCLSYQKFEPNTILCTEGDVANTLFIVFTGSVKATKRIPGQQEDNVVTYAPGHWFGETVFEKNKMIWEWTFSTVERSEILTLTKKEYDHILKIPGTDQLKTHLNFLKEIPALKEVSKQSLRRLANILTVRTFSKNRVITFQGDDAAEMFFIRTGECRVVMEIHPKSRTPSLPRASSSATQYWPSCHERCKQEIRDREKEWWRPSPVSRSSTRGSRVTSRCHSQQAQSVLPELPKETLSRPDVIYRMLTHKKAALSKQALEQRKGNETEVSGAKRPYTSPAPQSNLKRAIKKKPSIVAADEGDSLTPWRVSPDEQPYTRSTTRASNRSSQGYHASFADSTPKPASRSESRSKSDSISEPVIMASTARFKSPSAMEGRKRKLYTSKIKPSVMKKYTFSTFVRDCVEKNKSRNKEDLEFSEKENKLWQMGLTTLGTMPAVFMTNENLYYQKKFTRWARNVMDRERKLLSDNMLEETPTPCFMPELPQAGVLKTEQSKLSTPQFKQATFDDAASKTTMSATGSSQSCMSTILDIGALIDGQYFGEGSLLMESKRAASVVAVSLVETLVLNKWDFHRHCDKDVIKALAKHEYKREEEFYNFYMKTRKWEMFKKQVVEDICNAKSARKPSRGRPTGVLTKPDGRSIELPLKEWAY
uniref:Cyclic nucleotide-binding domain-containing protein n=1 Tax=Physcomitrium patens TaxID=3218 RepID=A0A2K1KW84_PHYPA|nr:hypothetical protein PHYPA_005052 [Physcomitrium patens]